MARKSLTGQLNMFDFFKNLEDSPMGEVQMVSLMPEEFPEEEEPVAAAEPEVIQTKEETSTPEVVIKPKTKPVSKKPRKTKKSEPVQVESVQEAIAQEEVSKEVVVEEEVQAPKKPIQLELSKERPVMSRQYEIDGKQIEIAYINYNKVRILKSGEESEIWEFSSSKEAVDYYVQKMQELEPEE